AATPRRGARSRPSRTAGPPPAAGEPGTGWTDPGRGGSSACHWRRSVEPLAATRAPSRRTGFDGCRLAGDLEGAHRVPARDSGLATLVLTAGLRICRSRKGPLASRGGEREEIMNRRLR